MRLEYYFRTAGHMRGAQKEGHEKEAKDGEVGDARTPKVRYLCHNSADGWKRGLLCYGLN